MVKEKSTKEKQEAMISLTNVFKRYSKQKEYALKNVSLDIFPGEFCLLRGASGAGKSTFLRLLFGDESPTQGHIKLNGRNISRLSRKQKPFLRRNIGFIFQDFKLLANYTALENVALALEVQACPQQDIQKRSLKMLEEVGLAKKSFNLAKQLSGGEQQRVAIARALVSEPSILLADEPTGNLDPKHSHAVMELLLKANAQGTTIIVATHDPALVRNIDAKDIILEGGELIGESSDTVPIQAV